MVDRLASPQSVQNPPKIFYHTIAIKSQTSTKLIRLTWTKSSLELEIFFRSNPPPSFLLCNVLLTLCCALECGDIGALIITVAGKKQKTNTQTITHIPRQLRVGSLENGQTGRVKFFWTTEKVKSV